MNYDKKRWRDFLVLSAMVHFIVLYFLVGDIFVVKYILPAIQRPVDVYVVDQANEKQFVAIDNEKSDKEANENARYLSKANRRVENETRARKWGSPKNSFPGVQAILQEDLNSVVDDYLKNKKSRSSANNESGEGESSSYDYLPGVRPGDQTVLNTAEFVYYSFYRRVEESIVYFWNNYVNQYINAHPDVRKNLSNRDYVTEVEALIDRNGAIVRTYVIRSSGVAGIDDAPGKAFVDASPFENPPKGMIEPDGFARMKWRFVVSVVEQIKYGIEKMDYLDNSGWPDPALERQMNR